MKIHEHQAKVLFSEYGIPVAASRVMGTAEDAAAADVDMALGEVVAIRRSLQRERPTFLQSYERQIVDKSGIVQPWLQGIA